MLSSKARVVNICRWFTTIIFLEMRIWLDVLGLNPGLVYLLLQRFCWHLTELLWWWWYLTYPWTCMSTKFVLRYSCWSQRIGLAHWWMQAKWKSSWLILGLQSSIGSSLLRRPLLNRPLRLRIWLNLLTFVGQSDLLVFLVDDILITR